MKAKGASHWPFCFSLFK